MVQLEFQSVHKRYVAAGPWVVDDLDLGVERGELLTLLGPSGCGKTTTLRLMAGLEWPSQGRILLGGKDVTRLGAADRQGTALVVQANGKRAVVKADASHGGNHALGQPFQI